MTAAFGIRCASSLDAGLAREMVTSSDPFTAVMFSRSEATASGPLAKDVVELGELLGRVVRDVRFLDSRSRGSVCSCPSDSPIGLLLSGH